MTVSIAIKDKIVLMKINAAIPTAVLMDLVTLLMELASVNHALVVLVVN